MGFSMQDIVGKAWPHFTVVDVGAMDIPGDQAPYGRILKPGKFQVIGFEAVKAECDKLNAARRPGHRYLNCFVGDGTRRTFIQTNESMTSSLFPPNSALLNLFNSLPEWTIPVSATEVQTTRLDDVPELADVCVDMIKIDVQGAEADVFAGASRALRDAVVVHTEVEFVPLYKGQPLYGDIARILGEAGFMHHGFLGLSGRAFRPIVINKDVNAPVLQNLWSDVLFVRDFTRLADLGVMSLLKMAIILHEIYGSGDLAQLCLAHYDKKAGTRFWEAYIRHLVGQIPPGFQKPV